MSDIVKENIVNHFQWLNDEYDTDILNRAANIENSDDVEEISDYRNGILCDLSDAIDISTGFTKIVFTFADVPGYVVKIPFAGIDWFSLGDDIEYEGFENYLVLNGFGAYKDYCALEEGLFFKACEDGVDEFFASTEKLCEINGVPIYVSEYCSPEKVDDISAVGDFDKLKQAGVDRAVQKSNSPSGFFNELIVENGVDKVFKLSKFILNYGIKDLHFDNWGVNSWGRLKITDYSGYAENSTYYKS